MSLNYQIVPASIRHVRPMCRQMRAAAVIATQAFDVDPRAALHRAFVASNYCRTALIDGKVAAMWGIVAPVLSDRATVWLVLAESTGRFPLAIVREAHNELQKAMESYSYIAMTVVPDDEASVRFARFLGFQATDGEFFSDDQDAMSDPRFRTPVGDQFVVRMGYAPAMVN